MVTQIKENFQPTRPLVAALIDVTRRVVEHSEHGDEAVGLAVGTGDVGTLKRNKKTLKL